METYICHNKKKTGVTGFYGKYKMCKPKFFQKKNQMFS